MKNKITKMEYGKRNKKRVNVYINSEFSFAVDEELVYQYKLEKDKVIDLESLQQIIEEDNYIKAKATALKTLERSHKTEKEIKDKLEKNEYPDNSIERVLEFLKSYEFINDEKFTKMFVEDKIKKYGKNKIKFDLIKKGINEKFIEENLNNMNDDNEKDTAKKIAEKKLKTLEGKYGERVVYSKVSNYLSSKGFSFDIIKEVMNSLVKMDINEDEFNYEKSEETKENMEELRVAKEEEEINKLMEIGKKKYRILLKSEKNQEKIYTKLSQYLLRRGYKWEIIKKVMNQIIGDDYE
ncbi:recombination regulator RecX [Clostridium grantii]|uniref:Regulatory protein RecX n=1 Tax=Clostridium grantii DSM 8605 TaxID=1121316 RepID=A0A1M5REZ1_9CLOT|nr:recombination regulator RecX [Clostridium grantii]SHH24778.1 regulatory protein [Clostridium grantii DSM 8605]